MTQPQKGITANRSSPDKIEFLIKNHGTLTRKELAEELGENERWIKRRVHTLIKMGKITPAHPIPEKTFNMADWKGPIGIRAKELHCKYFKPYREIAPILEKEFGITVGWCSVRHWLQKIGCKERTKTNWLEENVPKDKMEKLIDRGMRMVDISEYISKKFGVYVTDDLILVYIQKIGLMSQRQHRNSDPTVKINEYSKEWIEDKLNSHIGTIAIAKDIGVSTTILQRKMKELDLETLEHRIVWSDQLDSLRESLQNAPPIEGIPPEDIHQMILGWLIGDGHLDAHGRLVINHSLVQVSYLYLKARVLKKYLSNVCTVPRKEHVGDGFFVDGKEQLGISCPGLMEYTKYLLPDGNKNLEKIVSELNPLGWACYYMDDGSYPGAGRKIMSAKKNMMHLRNKYNFGESIGSTFLILKNIEDAYLIPTMAYKTRTKDVGEYWTKFAPELFNPSMNCDLDLSFINSYLLEKDDSLLNKVVKYYHKRGFPFVTLSDNYLNREFHCLKKLKTEYMWKNENLLKFIDTGNSIFKHFMKHMAEAKYRQASPMDIFNSFMPFSKCLQYCLKSKKSILPNFVHNALVYFNGGISGFPCAVAKAIVNRFSKEGDVIVDPCAGWGGRLLGTVGSERSYIGFEPWDKTFDALISMIKFFNIDQAMIHSGVFDSEKAPDRCNLVFTSPPYLDLEIYGKPMSENDWNELMRGIFRYAEEHLVKSGYLILNLPRSLKSLLPETKLEEQDCFYWYPSSKINDISKAEVCYVWKKLH